jgi:glycopeptide antibiotics resistance protein
MFTGNGIRFTLKIMKKLPMTLSIIAVAAVAVFFGYMAYHRNQPQETVGRDAGGSQFDRTSSEEDQAPQGGDLCGGTGGNGQIVSVGDNMFTMRRKDGINQIIHLSDPAIIETSAGSASLADLKMGNRVTLVGGPNPDGSFTADTVVVCNGTQENGTGQAAPITVRNGNPEKYEKVRSIVHTATILLVGLIWIGISAFLLLRKRESLVHVLFFTIFYIYLYKVLDYTLFQFQSLLLLQHFVPDLRLNGLRDGTNINLLPLGTLTLEDVRTSLLNILMMMPFGFGLPFITTFRMKKVVIAGLLFSIVIELLQLITGFMANTTFRVADINDVIFNTAGVVIGYILFIEFMRIYRRIFRNLGISTNPILRYIAERPQDIS